MELTIVLSVSSSTKEKELLETLESLPWESDGVDLIIYSENTKKIKSIISEGDLTETIRDSNVGVLFCETPEENSHHTIGLEDTKTEEVLFLNAGDIIEDFQCDLLTTAVTEPFGIPGLGKEGIPETGICYSCRTLPDSYRGIIFKAQWLRENDITEIDPRLTARICDIFREKLENQDYWNGWGNYDISESFSITRSNDNEEETIQVLQDLWNSHSLSYSDYTRDIIWTRIMTAAARIITKQDISNFNKYLYPVQKTVVLI